MSNNDHLIIIGELVTNGEALEGVLNIADQANATVAGVGVVVAKEFQGGSEWVKDHGYRLEALARISDFENNQVHFVGEE